MIKQNTRRVSREGGGVGIDGMRFLLNALQISLSISWSANRVLIRSNDSLISGKFIPAIRSTANGSLEMKKIYINTLYTLHDDYHSTDLRGKKWAINTGSRG